MYREGCHFYNATILFHFIHQPHPDHKWNCHSETHVKYTNVYISTINKTLQNCKKVNVEVIVA